MANIERAESVFITLSLANNGLVVNPFKQRINVNFCPDFIHVSNVTSRITAASVQDLSVYVTSDLPIHSSGGFATAAANGNLTFTGVLFPLTLSASTVASIDNQFQVKGQNDYINNTYTFNVVAADNATGTTAVGNIQFRLDFVKCRLQKETMERSSLPIVGKPEYMK